MRSTNIAIQITIITLPKRLKWEENIHPQPSKYYSKYYNFWKRPKLQAWPAELFKRTKQNPSRVSEQLEALIACQMSQCNQINWTKSKKILCKNSQRSYISLLPTAPHSSLILLTEIKSRLLFKFTTATGYSYTHSLSWRVHVTSFTWIWTWSESEIGNWMSSWTGICKTRASTKTHHKFPIFLKVKDILMKTQEQSLSNDKCLKKERSALTFFRQNIYLIIIEVCIKGVFVHKDILFNL